MTGAVNGRMTPRLRIARGPLRWWLRRGGFTGITLPPLGVFLLAERFDDERLRRHEAVHWIQYRARGALRFYVEYLLLLARHGYRDHPMEIEARAAEEAGR